MTCCLTCQYESVWLEVRSGAQELKVIIVVRACIVCVSIRIRRNTRRRKQEINSSFCGQRGSGSVLLWELTPVLRSQRVSWLTRLP